MLRLDHNRALSQLAQKTGKPVAVDREADRLGQPLRRRCTPTTASRRGRRQAGGQADQRRGLESKAPSSPRCKRGAAIIEARGLSSAASAANAAIDHVRDWMLGSDGKWVTMGVAVGRQLRHPEGRHVRRAGHHERRRVHAACTDLAIDDFSREKMDATLKELEEERAGVASLLGLTREASPRWHARPPPARRTLPRGGRRARSRCRCPARSTPITRILAEKSGFRALYLSGGGVAAGSLGMPDLGISNLDDVLTDVRRITDVCVLPLAGRRRHRLRRLGVQHRAHGQVADQGRRGGDAHRGPGRRQALRPSARQGARVAARRWSTASRPPSTRAPIAAFVDHGAHRCAGRRGARRRDRPRASPASRPAPT